MGITIHFEGEVGGVEARERVLDRARAFAKRQNWPVTEIPRKVRSLARVRDEAEWDYTGVTSGIELQPHPDSEPFRLEFDAEGYLQEYTKTQFAPLEIHILLVDLLRELEPSFSILEVVDESDFWDTGDSESLQKHFVRFFEVMEERKRNSNATGPHRTEDGRIIDLLEE